MTAMGDLASRLVVLVAVAFAVWLCLLVLFRRLPAPLAGLLAALLSWGLASVSASSRLLVGRITISVNGTSAPSASPPASHAAESPVAQRAIAASAPSRLSGACSAAPRR